MSQHDVERFFEILKTDLNLQTVLRETSTRDGVGDRAVRLAASRGLEITAEEFERKLAQVLPAAGASGELSDDQLEGVAGGKWSTGSTTTTTTKTKDYDFDYDPKDPAP